MVMYGADPEELDRIAAKMVATADELDKGAKGLTAAVATVAWFGEAALGFLSDWTGIKIPRLYLTTGFLRDTAKDLEQQAREQRLASDRCGDTYVKDAGWKVRERMASDLDDQLAGIRHQPADAQLAWWNSLTEAQREALIRNRSEDVFVIRGFPSDAVAEARAVWEREVAPAMVVVSETEFKSKVGAKVELIDALGGGKTKLIRYADGSADLVIEGGLGAGVSLGPAVEAEVMREGGIRLHFESQDELKAFTHRAVNIAMTRTPWLAKSRFEQLVQDHVSSVDQVSVASRSEFKAVGLEGSAKLEAALNIPDRTVTGTVARGILVKASPSQLGLEVSASMTAGVDGPHSVTLEFQGSSAYIGDEIAKLTKKPPTFLNVGGTQIGSATIELDLTDPDVRNIVPSIASAMKRGDAVGVLQEIGRAHFTVADRLEYHVAVGGQIEGGIKVDTGLTKFEAGASHAANTHVWIRPPGGEFIEVWSVPEDDPSAESLPGSTGDANGELVR